MTSLRHAADRPAPTAERIERLRQAAYRIRLNALNMGEVQGQGYIGQALGVADVLAVAYTDQLRHRPEDPHWPDRDRFLLSIGHYAIALYAALAEAGIIPVEELETYGSDDSRLPMSGMASYTPGMEISGGSLGHGLAVATGMALGLRHQGNPARVYNLLSDGELDEGSTWEAALQAAHHGLDNLTAIVDVNALQADGPTAGVLRTEPVTEKWQAFGWHALRVDGNDIAALVDAFDELRAHRGSPVGADLRHPHRPRRAAARDPREGPLHARRRARVADRPRPARGGTADPMTTTRPDAGTAAPKKRLTTSAMIASFADPGQRTTSAPFGHALARLAQERPEIVGLSADLAKYTDMHVFRDAHPDRFFQMGMAEQAMLGAAAGMAEVGLVPVRVHLLGVRHPPRLRLPVPRHRRAQPQRQRGRRPARADHRLRAQPPGHRGPGDPARLPEPDHRRPLRLGRHRAGRAAARRPPRADLPAAAPRGGAHRARRVRLPVRARQGRRAAHRPRRRAHLHRADDHAGAAGRGPAGGRPRRRRRAARAHDQAAGPRRDPARGAHRPARRHPARTTPSSAGSPSRSPRPSRSPGSGTRVVPIALPDEFLAAGALPTLHDRYGLSTDAVVSRVKAELDGARRPWPADPAPPTV